MKVSESRLKEEVRSLWAIEARLQQEVCDLQRRVSALDAAIKARNDELNNALEENMRLKQSLDQAQERDTKLQGQIQELTLQLELAIWPERGTW